MKHRSGSSFRLLSCGGYSDYSGSSHQSMLRRCCFECVDLRYFVRDCPRLRHGGLRQGSQALRYHSCLPSVSYIIWSRLYLLLLSTYVASGLDMWCEWLDLHLYVSTHGGDSVVLDWVYRCCIITLVGYNTQVDLKVLDIVDFDAILGMDGFLLATQFWTVMPRQLD